MKRLARLFGYVDHDFLVSAEHRARAEHENAQALRHALVREESRADQERAERISDREIAERRYQDLLARYTMLKLQGAVEVPPAAKREAVAESDPCVAAINRKSGGNPALRSMMLRQLAQDRAEEKSEADILAAITTGHQPNNGTPL